MRTKYTKQRVQVITDLIRENKFTIEEICQKVGISDSTFYTWKNKKQHFANVIDKAGHVINDNGISIPLKALKVFTRGLKRLNGY